MLQVSLYYRPEDIAAEKYYSNELYHSEEMAEVRASKVKGKCFVKLMAHSVSEQEVEDWTEEGPERWFYRRLYRAATREMVECEAGQVPPNTDRYPAVKTKLRCLDIFSGAGGLSLGLH